ncbi:MAG: serine hydrolase [Saprospiraceae bacterium]|nr:serine hydrolase [Saprospiraceae bacterium]
MAYKPKKKPAFLSEYNRHWVDSVFLSLTLEEKLGQLLMPRGNYSGKAHDVETLKMWVKKYKIGGLVFFASDPVTQAKLTNELQSLSHTPLFIGQDLEWGLGMRLDSTDRFPYAVSIGAIKNGDKLIEDMGREIGRQCRRIGVHINYAPVVDVNNNPQNPVINFRSFGADKLNVTAKGLAYMKGLESEHIIATAKHFPGHGDTNVDSHHDLPIITHPKSRLSDIELYPFKSLIGHGLPAIMTAHLNIPALEPIEGLASTFSHNIITNLLKKEMHFEGLTFTDAMEMKGAIKNFPKGEAMLKALLAGNDILETFIDVPETIETLKAAIKNGQLPIELVNQKVKKILMAKSWVGLDDYKPISLDGLKQDLNTSNSDFINYQLTEKSITCLKNENKLLPIRDLSQKIAVLNIDGDSISQFYTTTKQYTQVDYFRITKNSPVVYIDSLLKKLEKYDIVLATFHLIDIRASKNYGLNDNNTRLFKDLSKKNNVVISLLGNPYILNKLPELDNAKTLLVAYQQNFYTETITPQIIFGALPCVGIFPIDVSNAYKTGSGIFWDNIGRLSYGIPEQVSIDRDFLYTGLDSIIQKGLDEKAFPGCVLQVAKDGKVIFGKSYGFHTYEDAQNFNGANAENLSKAFTSIDDAMDNTENALPNPTESIRISDKMFGKVQMEDIFDLASLSKISTSLLAVMQLMSDGKINLEDTLGRYSVSMRGSNKSNLKFKDLLTHRAGLKAWIPFWKDAVDTIATMKQALILNPSLEKSCIVKVTKPGFFKRLFGVKPKKTIEYLESLNANPTLWNTMLTPETRIWKPGIFSANSYEIYKVPVAKNLYLNKDYQNQIMKQIAESPVDSLKKYVYSDLHFYLYPEIVKYITGENFDTYLGKTYKALGANSLTFNPWSNTSLYKIVPTEYDSTFRQQLLRGFVHDEGAALMGGISGHAGLFGNANDVMKLMQMYLWKGNFGGKNYISRDVIDTCTSYQFPEEKNRRGIGFDKKDFNPNIQNGPSLASKESYGHSGYTGTFTWVDPKYNLVYIFLSNRVYPTRNNNKISTLNIRTAIGDHIINSIIKE